MRACAVVVSLLVFAAAHRVPGAGLTLRDCISEAYGRSPALEAARFDLLAAEQEILKQQRAILPSLGVGATVQLLNGNPITPFAVLKNADLENTFLGQVRSAALQTTVHTSTDSNGRTITTRRETSTTTVTDRTSANSLTAVHFGSFSTQSLLFNYPLYQNGSIFGLNNAPAVAAARAQKKQQEWTTKLTEEKVVFNLSVAFFNALWFQEKLQRDTARVAWAEQRLAIVQLQFDLQLKLAQDVELANAQLAADRQTLVSTGQSARDTATALALLLGRKPGAPLPLNPASPPLPALPPLTGFLAGAMAAHPAVGAQQSTVEAARQKYLFDRAQLFPTVDFNTNYTVAEAFENHSTPSQFLSVLHVSAPIFDFGTRLAASRESREKVKAEQARTAQVDLDTRSAIAQLYNTIHDLDKSAALLEQAFILAGNKAKLARAQREAGAIDQLTLLETEWSLLGAMDALDSARFSLMLKYAELQSAAGGVWKWLR